jgi:hypothetical protein
MDSDARGERRPGGQPETTPDEDRAETTIKLPEAWSTSTVLIQRIHDALVAKRWGSGPY